MRRPAAPTVRRRPSSRSLPRCHAATLPAAHERVGAARSAVAAARQLRYLLTPLIDTLACRSLDCPLKLPRALAVVLALVVALKTHPYVQTLWALPALALALLLLQARRRASSEPAGAG